MDDCLSGLDNKPQASGWNLAARRAESVLTAAEAGPAVVKRRLFKSGCPGWPYHIRSFDSMSARRHNGRTFQVLTIITSTSESACPSRWLGV